MHKTQPVFLVVPERYHRSRSPQGSFFLGWVSVLNRKIPKWAFRGAFGSRGIAKIPILKLNLEVKVAADGTKNGICPINEAARVARGMPSPPGAGSWRRRFPRFHAQGKSPVVLPNAYADSIVAVCLYAPYPVHVPVSGVLGLARCQLVFHPCCLARWRADVLTSGNAGGVSGMASGPCWALPPVRHMPMMIPPTRALMVLPSIAPSKNSPRHFASLSELPAPGLVLAAAI